MKYFRPDGHLCSGCAGVAAERGEPTERLEPVRAVNFGPKWTPKSGRAMTVSDCKIWWHRRRQAFQSVAVPYIQQLAGRGRLRKSF
jgi:hypothetical protein